MRIAAVNGVKLHWREDGDPNGAPVVFANSLGTDLRLWDDIIPLLPRGLRLIRFDNRGHGLSSCPPAPYAMDDLVADTAALLDHLKITNCIFVGLSIGGVIAQGLAATRPDLLRAAVLSNSAARMGDTELWDGRIATVRSDGLAAMGDAVLERWFSDAFRGTDALEAWRNMLIRTPAEGYAGCCYALRDADMNAQTKTLSLPILCIGGTEDGASPPAVVRATADIIPGARYVEISGAGHLPCVEKPDEFADLITAFLKETGHVQ